jgi:hypothetical protein
MATSEEAQRAVAELNGRDLDGRSLKVEVSKPKTADTGRGAFAGRGGRRCSCCHVSRGKPSTSAVISIRCRGGGSTAKAAPPRFRTAVGPATHDSGDRSARSSQPRRSRRCQPRYTDGVPGGRRQGHLHVTPPNALHGHLQVWSCSLSPFRLVEVDAAEVQLDHASISEP